eukprot:8863500-Pyramimonas_sp.AAC.2
MGDSEGEVPCSGLERLSREASARSTRVSEMVNSSRKIDLWDLRSVSEAPRRGDLNMRFATNTFVNTYQANRHKDESRMWRARALEIKLDDMKASHASDDAQH